MNVVNPLGPFNRRTRHNVLGQNTFWLLSLQKISSFNFFSVSSACARLKQTPRIEETNLSLNQALRILSLISPTGKATTAGIAPRTSTKKPHICLIKDSLQTDLERRFVNLSLPPHTDGGEFCSSYSGSLQDPSRTLDLCYDFETKDPISVLSGLHREGLMGMGYAGWVVFPRAVAACGSSKNLHCGIQLHGLSIISGLSLNVYVGSALVTLYGKCGKLGPACKLFEEMPVRNVVSWTALISGFALESHVDHCSELFLQMQNSLDIRPNDYTFGALLSACTGSGSLGKGRVLHCQIIQLGFESFVHIANAVISMYCKCGHVHDAFSLFQSMNHKDIVSWNSMIAGFSLHGLTFQAIDLFEEMRRQKNIHPDSITFLNIISSCRHAGLLDQCRFYFRLMVECYGLNPILDHFSCLVDLLCRAGLLEEARDLVHRMPMKPNAIIWGTLLSSCMLRGDNIWIGIEAAERKLEFEPECSATHVQLANLYSRVGLWNHAAKVRKIMKDKVLKTNPGISWIEVGNKVSRFGADNYSNPKMAEVFSTLGALSVQLLALGHVPEVDEDIIE